MDACLSGSTIKLLLNCCCRSQRHFKCSDGKCKSFEDAVQFEIARVKQFEGIVTRNPQDFPSRDVLHIFTPEALIQQLS
jgi:hypothetical protein